MDIWKNIMNKPIMLCPSKAFFFNGGHFDLSQWRETSGVNNNMNNDSLSH